MGSVLDTTLCDKASQWLVTGQWFSSDTPISATNKTNRHDMTEVLLKVALNTIIPIIQIIFFALVLFSSSKSYY
jgi:hypothetical protein